MEKDNLRKMKRTIKDSVFCDLFSDPKYLLMLYHSVHPEDDGVTENDIEDVTLIDRDGDVIETENQR